MKRTYIHPASRATETRTEGHICAVSSWQVGEDEKTGIIEGNPDEGDGNFEPWPADFGND